MPPPQWREASACRLELAGVIMKAPSVLLIGPYDPHCGEYTFLAPPLGVWRLDFAVAAASYFAFGALALFTVVPHRDRGYIAPILPLYFLYVLLHLAPITVGFANWVALKLWHRRLYRDHYQSREELPGLHGALYRP